MGRVWRLRALTALVCLGGGHIRAGEQEDKDESRHGLPKTSLVLVPSWLPSSAQLTSRPYQDRENQPPPPHTSITAPSHHKNGSQEMRRGDGNMCVSVGERK